MKNLSHTFTIECAHSLPGIGDAAIHGHSYWVTVSYKTESEDPTPLAMVVGYCELVRGRLDHVNLNTLMESPTMESMADWIYREIQGPRPVLIRVARKSIGCHVDYVP